MLDKYNPPDHFLPESYTCFFLLKLPRYSCKQVLEEKLKYAIHFCKSIDTDDYARIALSGEPAADDSSEDSDNEDADSFASDSTQDYLTGHWTLTFIERRVEEELPQRDCINLTLIHTFIQAFY